MLPSEDAAGAADDPPLSASEISQAFARAQQQRRQREEEEEEGGGGKEEEENEKRLDLDLDRRKEGREAGRWRRALLRCFCCCGGEERDPRVR